MEQKQNLEVKINYDKPAFYVDELITGNLILISEKTSIIEKIVVRIVLIQQWKTEYDIPKRLVTKIGDTELHLSSTLSKVEGCYIMKGGTNKIPFILKLTDFLDPCFEYPVKDRYAYLRYKLNIIIYSMSFKNINFTFGLRLLSRPNIDSKKKCLTKSVSKPLKKWNLFSIGTPSLTVSIPDNNVKYDDNNFKIIINIDNRNGKESTREIKVKLMRTIEFYGKNNFVEFKEEMPVASKDLATIIEPGSQQYIDIVLPLRETDTSRYKYTEDNPIPYDFFISDINFYMPTIFSRWISCKYELIISLYFDCHISESNIPKITFPIYLVNQSPFEYLLEKQKKEVVKKNENKLIFFDNKDNNKNNNNNIINNNNNNNNNNFYNINEIGNEYQINIINNYEENANQIDAPSPFIQEKNIDIDLNIFEQNNNKNVKDNEKKYTNNPNSINVNTGNNIKYNVNINISNNIDNNINNNNIINNNYNNNIIIDNSNFNLFDNDNEEPKKNIKESNFNLI